ncbi:sigma 54-interacting transcriptional regulator [Geomonas nitrogeniifigens]|uniref:sigma 54-interacting transcriptional regulator n=1 Tax=Geomonas diazotrophica TaxID=2843197 RepID=UPI001C2CB998|nr:sigma 54-interacting transcriptional regulator [Geomonas nitrogeniifigens]QXE85165.1 sigma 54-interacting transcriptional regulator [Geomonas nitrogeniifigens]
MEVDRRLNDLARANMQLTQEIEERKRAEGSLLGAYAEIKRLKDRFQAENRYMQQEIAKTYNFGEVIGRSNAILQLLRRVEQAAFLNTTVLLIGEAGTGKRVAAHAIHNKSSRRDRPMVTVNLAALPPNLVECELFGWESGECAGAEGRQIGRFELADASTILLEEIAELSPELQGRLLRLIQDGELQRMDSPRTIKVDVRVIVASNRDLEPEVRAGRFREDLFCRLSAFPITIPPLRKRKEDIPLLVDHFLAKHYGQIGKKAASVSSATLGDLQSYHWPGNVRELENIIERALITGHGGELQVWEKSGIIRTGEMEIKALAELERGYIFNVLQKTGWRIEGDRGAAVLLGLNPSTLRARMRKFGILRQYRRDQ